MRKGRCNGPTRDPGGGGNGETPKGKFGEVSRNVFLIETTTQRIRGGGELRNTI